MNNEKEHVLSEFLILQESKKQLVTKAKIALYQLRLAEVDHEFGKITGDVVDLQRKILSKEMQLINYEKEKIKAAEIVLAAQYAKLHGEMDIDPVCTSDYLILLYQDSTNIDRETK